jgi:hypothetical protein
MPGGYYEDYPGVWSLVQKVLKGELTGDAARQALKRAYDDLEARHPMAHIVDPISESDYRLDALRALRDANEHVQPDPIAGAGVADTGNYDDSHNFGWKKPDEPDWNNLSADQTAYHSEIRDIEASLNLEAQAAAEDEPAPKPEGSGVGRPTWLWGLVGLGVLAAVLIGGWIGLYLLGGGPAGTPNVTAPPVAAATPTLGFPTLAPATQPGEPDPNMLPDTPSPPPGPMTLADRLQQLIADYQLSHDYRVDPTGDWNEADPGINPSVADLTGVGQVPVRFAPGTIQLVCNPHLGVICGGEIDPGITDYQLFIMQTAGPITGSAGAFLELGIAAFDETPRGGGDAVPLENAFGFMNGNNTYLSLRFGDPAQTGPLLYFLVHGENDISLHTEETNGFALVADDVATFFVPLGEWDGIHHYRDYSYFQNNTPLQAVSDVWPPLTSSPESLPDPNDEPWMPPNWIPGMTIP